MFFIYEQYDKRVHKAIQISQVNKNKQIKNLIYQNIKKNIYKNFSLSKGVWSLLERE